MGTCVFSNSLVCFVIVIALLSTCVGVLYSTYVFADCGSVDLLFGIPCGIGIVLVVVLSHCCWSYYVCRISLYLHCCYVFGGTGVILTLYTHILHIMIIITQRKWNAQL
jgi:hypothetical protein